VIFSYGVGTNSPFPELEAGATNGGCTGDPVWGPAFVWLFVDTAVVSEGAEKTNGVPAGPLEASELREESKDSTAVSSRLRGGSTWDSTVHSCIPEMPEAAFLNFADFLCKFRFWLLVKAITGKAEDPCKIGRTDTDSEPFEHKLSEVSEFPGNVWEDVSLVFGVTTRPD
jgi:hypothetical protein